MKLRIGTRGSDLALWQARHVAARLAPEAECELVILKTRGDVIDDVPLQSVEGKAFFTGEIEQALLEGHVDLAVHSHKDLPTAMTPGLSIAAVPARASQAERLLVLPGAFDPFAAFLPVREGARVGTSSPRRAAQLALLRPDLCTGSLRGNVPTRVQRLREGRHDAIVLAAAGLDRLELDLQGLHAVDLPLEWFVPAPAQGALAIQIREHDAALRSLLARRLHDPHAARAVAAERGLLERAGGGCNLPLGAAITGQGPYRACVFLGAGHPRPADVARWSSASAETPEQAAELAFEGLDGPDSCTGPLGERTIAIAGSKGAPRELESRLRALGATVVVEEVIAFEDLDAPDLCENAARLERGDAMTVTSREAARRLAGVTLSPGVLLAAVGEGTAAALRAVGLEPALVGTAGGGELATRLALAPEAHVLFPCAEETAGELEQALAARHVHVERMPLYRTVARPDANLCADADLRIVLSPSAARALAVRLPPNPTVPLLALGPRTGQACVVLGWRPYVCSGSHVEAVVGAAARLLIDRSPQP